jgi:hypothetical protein
MRCDIIAQGIIAAATTLKLKIPIVVRLQGNDEIYIWCQKSAKIYSLCSSIIYTYIVNLSSCFKIKPCDYCRHEGG